MDIVNIIYVYYVHYVTVICGITCLCYAYTGMCHVVFRIRYSRIARERIRKREELKRIQSYHKEILQKGRLPPISDSDSDGFKTFTMGSEPVPRQRPQPEPDESG